MSNSGADRSVVCRYHIMLQAEILLHRRNPLVADVQPPFLYPRSKETRCSARKCFLKGVYDRIRRC